MSMYSRTAAHRRTWLACTAVVTLALTACGSAKDTPPRSGAAEVGHGESPSAPSEQDADIVTSQSRGSGLTSEWDEYRFEPLPRVLNKAGPLEYRYRISDPRGNPVTELAGEPAQQMRLYVIRADLTGYQHVSPTIGPDGMWTAGLATLRPGDWRVFVTFTPAEAVREKAASGVVLSHSLHVAGVDTTAAAAATANTATADGYTVTVNGTLQNHVPGTIDVTLARGGQPCTDLEPYEGGYVQLTAFRAADNGISFAYIRPETRLAGDRGGPKLSFRSILYDLDGWRTFVQFQTAGRVHTAALTPSFG
jgi:hypothetical protein